MARGLYLRTSWHHHTKGKDIVLAYIVKNADDEGCQETTHSHSEILILVNQALILRFLKCQKNTARASTYASELLGMRLLSDIMIKRLVGFKLCLLPLHSNGRTIILNTSGDCKEIKVNRTVHFNKVSLSQK